MESPQQRQHLLRALAVQGAGGLVGQQQIRVVDQRPGYRQPLTLPARERVRQPPAVLADTQQTEQFTAREMAARRRMPPRMPGSTRLSRTLTPSSRLKNWKITPTWRRRNPRQPLFVAAVDPLTRHLDAALIGPVEPGDDVEQGGLPAAGGPHQRDELAGPRRRSRARAGRGPVPDSASNERRTPRTRTAGGALQGGRRRGNAAGDRKAPAGGSAGAEGRCLRPSRGRKCHCPRLCGGRVRPCHGS